MLDDEARNFFFAQHEIEPAKEFLRRAVQGKLVRDADAKAVEVALSVGERDTTQATKARGWGIKTVRNVGIAMVLTVGGVLLGGYGKEIGAEIAKQSLIAKRVQEVVVNGEKALLEILSHLPADIRAALQAALDALRRSASSGG